MADPKYADLPGIALDEPDVYETHDLPESEQTVDFYEPENEPIERIHISTEEAHNKFRGKFLNAATVDFSENVGKRLKTGYDARSGEWGLAGLGERETPVQKYQRLQCEMKELLEEVKSLQDSKKSNADTPIALTSQQVEDSLKQLANLKLEESLGEDIILKISDPQGTQIQKLLSQLEQFKNLINEKPESQTQSDKDTITYQFSYRPEHARLQQTGRIAELEGRLHKLETVLGSSDEKMSRLTTATNKAPSAPPVYMGHILIAFICCQTSNLDGFNMDIKAAGSLLEAAQYLSATASLLDSSQLDHIEGRLAGLAQRLDVIAGKKKEIQEDEEKNKMILELYDLVKNSESVMTLLPKTIERLKSLEGLHKKAADSAKTVSQIELLQSEIQGNVQNNKTLLQGVQESFAMNLNEINQTVTNLDARIKTLKNK